jgi:hypothetical protein
MKTATETSSALLASGTDERIIALVQHLGLDKKGAESINISSYNDNILEYGDQEYYVMDDDEADREYERQLDDYIDESILPEIPEAYRQYFDSEKWKDDARIDGSRGQMLNSWDGNEHEEEVNGTDYYIYRR